MEVSACHCGATEPWVGKAGSDEHQQQEPNHRLHEDGEKLEGLCSRQVRMNVLEYVAAWLSINVWNRYEYKPNDAGTTWANIAIGDTLADRFLGDLTNESGADEAEQEKVNYFKN